MFGNDSIIIEDPEGILTEFERQKRDLLEKKEHLARE
jgi:hypothetical protein